MNRFKSHISYLLIGLFSLFYLNSNDLIASVETDFNGHLLSIKACKGERQQNSNIAEESGSLQFIEVPSDTIIDICEGWYSYPLPVATSSCNPVEIFETQIETDNPECEYGYTLERIFTATDACGNEISVSQFVYFSDLIPPLIEIEDNNDVLYWPCNQFFDLEYDIDIDIYDDCGGVDDSDITVAMIESGGSCSTELIQVYTWTAIDACGNVAVDSLTVEFYDDSAPHEATVYLEDESGQVIASVFIELDYNSLESVEVEITDISEDDIYVDVVDDCSPNTSVSLVSIEVWDNYTYYTYSICDDCGNCDEFELEIEFPAVYGCLDPLACNYEPDANIDDFCDYTPAITFSNFPNDTLIDCSDYSNYVQSWPVAVVGSGCFDYITLNQETVFEGFCVSNYSLYNTFTIHSGCCTPFSQTQVITVFDSLPPLITGDDEVIVDDLNASYATAEDLCSFGSSLTFTDEQIFPNIFERTYTAIDECGNSSFFTQNVILNVPGCLNPNACNYNPDATVYDEESCIFGGCMDPEACNFDPDATCEFNESCIYPWGELSVSLEYNPVIYYGIELELIKAENFETIFQVTQQTTNFEDPTVFEEVPVGIYYLRAKPNAELGPGVANLGGAYVDSVYYWNDSSPFEIECGSYQSFNLDVIELQELNGSGAISGYIFNAGQSANPDYGQSETMSSVPVVLVDTENTMQNTELPLPVGYALSDDLGMFQFDNVPPGNYSIIVDIPGLLMFETSNIEVSADQSFEAQNFYVVTDAGIYSADCICEPVPTGSIDGVTDWNAACGLRNVTIEVYNLDNSELDTVFNTIVDVNGEFQTPEFPSGTYNILVTVEGYLTKLISNIEIEEGMNELAINSIILGDLNGSNSVNVTDLSLVGLAFGSTASDANYNYLADFNCNGLINIVDLSLLNVSFGLGGDIAPVNE